jgi:hypothetical protein
MIEIAWVHRLRREAAVQIRTLLGEISAAIGAALIGAGLLSVMLFPLLALMLVGGSGAKRNGHER